MKKIAALLLLMSCISHASQETREVVYPNLDIKKPEIQEMLRDLEIEGIKYYFTVSLDLHIILPKEISADN